MNSRSVSYSLLRRVGVLLLTMVVVAFSAPYATALVLCICHDGHISVEINCNPDDCCPDILCDSDPSDDLAVSSLPSAHGCIDLVIESTTSPARNARQDGLNAQLQPELRGLLVTAKIALFHVAPHSPMANHGAALPIAPPIERSVVLTI